MRFVLLIFAVLISGQFPLVQTDYQSSDFVSLYNAIVKNYNKDVNPVAKTNESTSVTVSFKINGISDFDEVTGELKVVGVITLQWVNTLLTWNPNTYGKIDEFVMVQNDVWHPPVTLENAMGSLNELGSKKQKIRISPDGTCLSKIPVILAGACSVDVTYFPFDIQICSMDFMCWHYTTSEVYLSTSQSAIDITEIEENIQWQLTDSSVESSVSDDLNSRLKYTMTLVRRPMYFLIVMIAPVVLLGFMNVFAFYINIEEGRVGFAMNAMLTYSIFLTLVGDNLPRSSDPMSLLSYYLVCEVGVSGIITVLSIFSVRMHVKEDDLEVPRTVLTFISCICCNICKNPNAANQVAPEDAEYEKKKKKAEQDSLPWMQATTFEMSQIESLPSSVKFGAPNQKWKTVEEDEQVDMSDYNEMCYVPKLHWIQAAKSLDHFFFIVTFAGQVALACIFLLPIALNQM